MKPKKLKVALFSLPEFVTGLLNSTSFVDTVFGDSNVSPCVAQLRFYNPTSPFPNQAPFGLVSLDLWYYEDAKTSCSPSLRTSFPSLESTIPASNVSYLLQPINALVVSLGFYLLRCDYPNFALIAMETTRSPSFPDGPSLHLPCS